MSLLFISSHSLILVFHSTGLKKRSQGGTKLPRVEGGPHSWSQAVAVPHTERTGHDGSRRTVHPARRLAGERGWELDQGCSGERRQQLNDRERKNSLLDCCPDVVHVMGSVRLHLTPLTWSALSSQKLFTVVLCENAFWEMSNRNIHLTFTTEFGTHQTH